MWNDKWEVVGYEKRWDEDDEVIKGKVGVEFKACLKKHMHIFTWVKPKALQLCVLADLPNVTLGMIVQLAWFYVKW